VASIRGSTLESSHHTNALKLEPPLQLTRFTRRALKLVAHTRPFALSVYERPSKRDRTVRAEERVICYPDILSCHGRPRSTTSQIRIWYYWPG
jgi:hypothetical protein